MQHALLTVENARKASERFIDTLPPYPGGYQGRGIVICGGGEKYFASAWVCINMLRRFKCQLPIQFWHLGRKELDEKMASLLEPLGVRCIDAEIMREKNPCRILRGWELKPYSMIHCPFKEVMLIDADNVPVSDPTYLFETPPYKETGAIFWPDYGRLATTRAIWGICGVPYRDEPEFESGQVVVDKEKCWQAQEG